MNHSQTRMNGKEVSTLTLASKSVDTNLYSTIQTKLNVSPLRAKYYVAAYIIGRNNFMAANIAADHFGIDLDVVLEHMEVVDDLMSGTVE